MEGWHQWRNNAINEATAPLKSKISELERLVAELYTRLHFIPENKREAHGLQEREGSTRES